MQRVINSLILLCTLLDWQQIFRLVVASFSKKVSLLCGCNFHIGLYSGLDSYLLTFTLKNLLQLKRISASLVYVA